MAVVGAGVIGTGQAQHLDVVLEGGRTYSFSVHPSEPGVDFDLHIYDQNGNLVTWDESPAADAYGMVTPFITGPFESWSTRSKGCPRIASRFSPERSNVRENVQQHVHLADALEAEALEDRPGHRAALGDQGRRSEGDRVVPAASDQRSVGTSAAGTFRGRAAVEQQAVLGRRGRAGADDLAVEPDRVP